MIHTSQKYEKYVFMLPGYRLLCVFFASAVAGSVTATISEAGKVDVVGVVGGVHAPAFLRAQPQ